MLGTHLCLYSNEEKRTSAILKQPKVETELLERTVDLLSTGPPWSRFATSRFLKDPGPQPSHIGPPGKTSSSGSEVKAKLLGRKSSGWWTPDYRDHVVNRTKKVVAKAVPYLPVPPMEEWAPMEEHLVQCPASPNSAERLRAWGLGGAPPVSADVDILILIGADGGPVDPESWALILAGATYGWQLVLAIDALDNVSNICISFPCRATFAFPSNSVHIT